MDFFFPLVGVELGFPPRSKSSINLNKFPIVLKGL